MSLDDKSLPRVLSIQSHVVHGYVGNRCAVFPLNLLGFDVDAVNSVQFSNHSGYPSLAGKHLRLTGNDLLDLVSGLDNNNLLSYDYLLTGYIGSVSFCEAVVSVFQQMKLKNPNAVFVCDPVLGDDGRFYVPPELADIYRDKIIVHATVITPNQFELEQLAQMKIETDTDVFTAMDMLHSRGIPIIVMSSASYGGSDNIVFIASHRSSTHATSERFKMEIPKFPRTFSGTGDLFASLFLAWLHIDKGNVRSACSKAVSSLQAVLRRTFDAGSRELALIASKRDIENPDLKFTLQEV